MEFEFDFGALLEDSISGFRGVVVARVEYANGCKEYALCAKRLQNGQPIDLVWIGENRMIFVGMAKKSADEEPISQAKVEPYPTDG